jgi:hypothetical protein
LDGFDAPVEGCFPGAAGVLHASVAADFGDRIVNPLHRCVMGYIETHALP